MKRFDPAMGSIFLFCAAAAAQTWGSYGGDPGGARFSSLSQISRSNVAALKVAWTFHTGDVSDGKDGGPKSKFEVTPILFNDTLYTSTPFNRVIALNPEDGTERWSYDPKIDRKRHYSESLVSRGVSAWQDRSAASSAPCKRRIFLATLDARLIALDANDGKPCEAFGTGGTVDLTQGIGNTDPGQYEVTSPVAIVNDIVVVGRRGKQYVVIASGGHGDLPVSLGDSIIAYALP